MKLILTTILIVTFALSSFAQSLVQGHVTRKTGAGIPNATITLYDVFGLPVTATTTEAHGYYSFYTPVCCGTYIVMATSRRLNFIPSGYIIQTQFDDGDGFTLDFKWGKSSSNLRTE